jgi:ribonuclease E
MANKMLIDAAHPEETRVVVLRGSRVEEFDFESANKKQLRGNIYLAKVTRVEPSLQAAFVEYGGNRHGFLAFAEIHPDYYQIPVSDRQALIDAEAQEEHDEEEERRPRRSRRRRGGERHATAAHRPADETVSADASDANSERVETEGSDTETAQAQATSAEPVESDNEADADTNHHVRPVTLEASATPPYDDPTAALIEHASVAHEKIEEAAASSEAEAPAAETTTPETATPADAGVATGLTDAHPAAGGEDARPHETDTDEDAHDDDDDHEDEHVEQLGGDALEEVPTRAYRSRRQYKIQEVIKRRQVLLVQVVKEERGNKGAALTTYLSLAGRYSVLMPNTARGGGISRKITDASDRQRLKSIAQDLDVPDGMGVILRTAGAARTKPEVKRDFEYLMRMWETVRETTLNSQAPTLVYEEGSLIKRSIRDLYNKDVEEIVVSGEDAYREAKDFMRLLMPSHARNVQPWRDPQPIFTKAGAEAQLDAMFSSHVTLKSGGYIVINQTEALVAIDVNSGRSTREHNIEDTALRTNLEAADEVARQLRLRDLAGLIVVDFIDMEENRNNRAVERRMKDALKNDRARIQIGRISHFGLLEMSRQRIRTGVLEGSTVVCEHCAGAGMVRSTSSIALHVLRVLEDALISDASHNVVVRTRVAVALYILNQKRAHLTDLELRFGVAVTFDHDSELTGTSYCAIERGEPATGIAQPSRQIPIYAPEVDDIVDPEPEPDDEDGDEADQKDVSGAVGSERPRGDEAADGRRKRRRRRGRDRVSSDISGDAPQPSDDALSFVTDINGVQSPIPPEAAADESGTEDDGEGSTVPSDGRGGRRRRSRRGGRRAREGREKRDETHDQGGEYEVGVEAIASEGGAAHPVDAMPPTIAHVEEPAPAPAVPEPVIPETVIPETAVPETAVSEPTIDTEAVTKAAEHPERDAPKPEPVSSELDPSRPKRSGWWQRAKASLGG